MIRINLIKNQVPSRIDLPRKKINSKFIRKALAVGLFFLIIISFVIYFIFVKGSEKIAVQIPKKHTSRTTVTHKNIETINKQKISEPAEQIQKTKTHKQTEQGKQKPKQPATVEVKTKKETHKKAAVKIEPTGEKKPQQQENTKKIIQKLKETTLPVFSLNIKLNKIPKPAKHKNENNKLYQELISSNKISDNETQAENPKNLKTKNIVRIRITTKKPYLMKKYLKSMGIIYKVKRIVYKTITFYEIFVGGFDSYQKIAKFALDLKSKGYRIYKLSNIGLLFYVCIDRNADTKMKDRYVSVWSKTPFKILAVGYKKKRYKYQFEFQCSKKQLKILKKRGYYPIILKSYKNGA